MDDCGGGGGGGGVCVCCCAMGGGGVAAVAGLAGVNAGGGVATKAVVVVGSEARTPAILSSTVTCAVSCCGKAESSGLPVVVRMRLGFMAGCVGACSVPKAVREPDGGLRCDVATM